MWLLIFLDMQDILKEAERSKFSCATAEKSEKTKVWDNCWLCGLFLSLSGYMRCGLGGGMNTMSAVEQVLTFHNKTTHPHLPYRPSIDPPIGYL